MQVEDYKTLYAVTPTSDDGNKYANYSGEFKKYPADFLNILNDDTITNAEIYMLNGNIPIINPSKIKDKTFYINLYNESDLENYGYINKDYDETALTLNSTKGLMLLGNDNHQESILYLTISPEYTDVPTYEPTTQVTLLNGSPSIYLYETSSKFEFNINTLSDYYDKPFMQYDSAEEEYLLRIFDVEDYTTIKSFDGIILKNNETDKIVYTSIPQPLNDETPYNIQYFILPSQKGSIPKYTINADTPNICLYEKVTFTIDGYFTPDTQFKWYANRKLVQDSTEKSYTHTAQFTNDEVLCFIYQDENNYTTEQINLNVTKDTTPIALYSAVSDPGFYHLYNLTLTDVKNISKGISSISLNDIDENTSHIDNCYGNNDTLWWVTDSWIYNSNNVSLEMPNLRYIDFDTDTLYATTMDASAIIYKITEEDIGKYSSEQLFFTEAAITCITFHNDYCYTIEEVSDDANGNTTTYTLKKYDLSRIDLTTGQLTSEGQTPLLTKTTKVDDNWNETITFSSLIFDNEAKSIANTLKNPLFSDIQVTNEGIFVLFNDCYYKINRENATVNANSRGGIIKFTNELKLDTNFGSNGIFGWTNEVHTSYGTNDNITYTIYSYMPDFPADTQLSSEYFYSPRKFLAIKPKKLIFADDGFMFYGNSDNTIGKDVNQVIEFDIENAIFESYNLDQDIHFNKRAEQASTVPGSFTWDN